jgi:hypothetical protein
MMPSLRLPTKSKKWSTTRSRRRSGGLRILAEARPPPSVMTVLRALVRFVFEHPGFLRRVPAAFHLVEQRAEGGCALHYGVGLSVSARVSAAAMRRSVANIIKRWAKPAGLEAARLRGALAARRFRHRSRRVRCRPVRHPVGHAPSQHQHAGGQTSAGRTRLNSIPAKGFCRSER